MAFENPSAEEAELATRQALQYGKDLARIYVAEKAKREKLEVAYQAMGAIFASTPDGLIVLNDSLVIQQANTAFEKLVDAPPQSTVGLGLGTVLVAPELVPALEQLAASGESAARVELAQTKPTRRSLLANIARLQSGSLRGWVITFHDQSQRKRMEYQKSEFINIAAHELRTPLATVMGYADILQNDLTGKLDEQQQQLMDALLRGGKRLNKMVNQLLQFAQLNTGSSQPQGVTEFNLGELIEEISADLEQQAEKEEVELRVAIADPELMLTTDPSLLRTALNQIVFNGINFNKPGGYVSIEQMLRGEHVHLRVRDNGVGISKADLETIFEPFFQVQDHNIRSVNGLGLGLSVAQRAITELGGTISVESTLGKGTIFILQIPVQRKAENTPELSDLQSQLETTQQQSLAYARDVQTLYKKLQEANRQLREVNTQLEEANKLKSNFLGVITHELRSPFASIDFALQTFARYGMDHLHEQQRELFEQLTGNVNGARQMIDNLVAYAALLSKQGRLNLQSVDVDDLIRETAATLEPKAVTRGIEWSVDLPTNLILPAADRDRLNDALWHLMLNAIKFTKAGGHITTRAYADEDYVVIEVEDTGIGISEEDQTKIWAAFDQLADPLKRGAEGLGLGLALVRYVAVAHGGNVVLKSEPGVGSVFGLWLPIQLREEE